MDTQQLDSNLQQFTIEFYRSDFTFIALIHNVYEHQNFKASNQI
jgi:hypothetical protein